jgi:hypothetical protein
MYSPLPDLEWLLAASRELLELEELDIERLEAWRTERHAIFCRLKQHMPMSSDGFASEPLLRQLLDADAKICRRATELQARLAKQIAAARIMLQTPSHGSFPRPQLLQRRA